MVRGTYNKRAHAETFRRIINSKFFVNQSWRGDTIIYSTDRIDVGMALCCQVYMYVYMWTYWTMTITSVRVHSMENDNTWKETYVYWRPDQSEGI